MTAPEPRASLKQLCSVVGAAHLYMWFWLSGSYTLVRITRRLLVLDPGPELLRIRRLFDI
jgi:hypothetical protein